LEAQRHTSTFYDFYGLGPWLAIEGAFLPRLQMSNKFDAVLEAGRVPGTQAFNRCQGLPGSSGCVVRMVLWPGDEEPPCKRRLAREKRCVLCCPYAMQSYLMSKSGRLTKLMAPINAICGPLFLFLLLRLYYFTNSELRRRALLRSCSKISARIVEEFNALAEEENSFVH
jgi:hypothetical protein